MKKVSKKTSIVLKHLFAAENEEELIAFISRLKLSDPDSGAREILGSAVFVLQGVIKEIEELLAQRTVKWTSKDTTDLEGLLQVLTSHHWFGTDPTVKKAATISTASRKLLNKITLIKDGKIHES